MGLASIDHHSTADWFSILLIVSTRCLSVRRSFASNTNEEIKHEMHQMLRGIQDTRTDSRKRPLSPSTDVLKSKVIFTEFRPLPFRTSHVNLCFVHVAVDH